MATDWRRVGESVGAAIAEGVKRLGLGDMVRERFAGKYGVCRVCKEPLAGVSQEQVCEGCHADEALGVVLGGDGGADA